MSAPMNPGNTVTANGVGRSQIIAVAAAFSGLAVGYPSVYSSTATAFILPLTAEFGWGRMVPSLMFVCAMLGISLSSFFLGRIMDKYGAPWVAGFSALALAGILVGQAYMNGSEAMALGLAFGAGLFGAGTGVGLYVSILPLYFTQKLGFALGLTVIGQSLGAMLMPWLAASIIGSNGWQVAYMTLAAVHLMISLLVVAIMFKCLPETCDQHSLSQAKSLPGVSPADAMRTRHFWYLALVIFLQTMAMFGIAVHLFPFYSDRGVPWESLPLLTIMTSIGMIIGRIISGYMLDKIDARWVAAALFILGGTAPIWLALADTATGADLWIPPFLVGLALGAESDILAYIVRCYFGLRYYAVIYNRMLVAYFIGTMAGPLLVGWAFDNLDDSNIVLWVLAASALAAGLGSLMLKAPKVEGSA